MFQGRAVPGYALLSVGLALILWGGDLAVVGLLALAGGGVLLVQAYRKGW